MLPVRFRALLIRSIKINYERWPLDANVTKRSRDAIVWIASVLRSELRTET
jgi:hypothetical protein